MTPDADIIPIRRRSGVPGAAPLAPPLRRASGDDGWWTGEGAAGRSDAPWARPERAGAGPAAGRRLALPGAPLGASLPGASEVAVLGARARRPSPAVLRRRRAVLAAAVVVALVVLLALPLQTLAGRSVAADGAAGSGAASTVSGGSGAGAGESSVAAPAGGPASATDVAERAGAPLRAGERYVVQPGDTLWSIATRLDPTGDPRVLVARLEAQTDGDPNLVPGEHLRLP